MLKSRKNRDFPENSLGIRQIIENCKGGGYIILWWVDWDGEYGSGTRFYHVGGDTARHRAAWKGSRA